MQLTSVQKQFINANMHENVHETALRFKRDDMPLLLAQIAGRQTAEKKIPLWFATDGIFYPPHLSVEQSSSELTARYKASLLSGIGEVSPLRIDDHYGTFPRPTGDYAGTFPRPTGDHTGTFPKPTGDHDETFPKPTGDHTGTFPKPTGDHDGTFPKPTGDHDETFPKPTGDHNGTFADLTGGMGVDFSFLSPCFAEAAYVEQNVDLCRIAEHNFRQLGLKNATIHCTNAKTFLKETAPLNGIYIDPSRRDDKGRRVFRIEDCSPNVLELKQLILEKSHLAMVKYSPMLDIVLAVKSLGCVNAVHVVSVDNECKELLFLLSKTAADEPLFTAVNLKRTGESEFFSFTMAQERNCRLLFTGAVDGYSKVSKALSRYNETTNGIFHNHSLSVRFSGLLGQYLYEPNASILKAGAFQSVAQEFNLQKLHINSHLYTSDIFNADFPGRIFKIESCFTPNKKNLAIFLKNTKKANIAVRNFPMSVADIRRKTGLTDGGGIFLFATTLHDEQKVWIICRKCEKDS